MRDEDIKRLMDDTAAKVGPVKNRMAMPAHQAQPEFSSVLVLVPENTPHPSTAQLKGLGQVSLATAGNIDRALIGFESFESVYVYSPGFEMLGRIAALSDDEPLVRLLLQALLYGKKAGVLLAKSPEKLPAGLRCKLNERLDRLRKLGLYITQICCAGCAGGCPGEAKGADTNALRGLLLEDDVITLHRQGQTEIRLTQGCILTTLAADKARELGLLLVRS